MNVVLLCRVSTCRQDYDRQVQELTDYCVMQGWDILRIFTAKVSGKNKLEERPDIQELVKFVQTHAVDQVVVLEISRLGRSTLEALKVIELLNEEGVSLHIKNYNLTTLSDRGKVNPVVSLLCTILLEVASMERLTIAERMASGRTQYISRCRRDGVKMGRPASYRKPQEKMKQQYSKDITLLRRGYSLRDIHSITGTSIMTLRKVRDMFVSPN